MPWIVEEVGLLLWDITTWDFEADLLKMIQNEVEIKPALQEMDFEWIDGPTGDEARPDIRAQGVWHQQGQNAFFDICLTNINVNSQINQSVETILKKHEKEKKRAYNSRIMNVEHRTFTRFIIDWRWRSWSVYVP